MGTGEPVEDWAPVGVVIGRHLGSHVEDWAPVGVVIGCHLGSHVGGSV